MQAEVNLVELRTCLAMVNEARTAANVELETANAKRESTELQVFAVKGEIKTLLSKSGCLEEESENRRLCRRKLWPRVGIWKMKF